MFQALKSVYSSLTNVAVFFDMQVFVRRWYMYLRMNRVDFCTKGTQESDMDEERKQKRDV